MRTVSENAQLLSLLLGLGAGSVATSAAGAAGGISAACIIVLLRFLSRMFAQTFGWPPKSSSSERSTPLLSNRIETLEDELRDCHQLIARLEDELRGRHAPPPTPPPAVDTLGLLPRPSDASRRVSGRLWEPLSRVSRLPSRKLSAVDDGARLGARTETVFAEERFAAEVDGLAARSSSELHVAIENDADDACTVVRVTAPNRTELLADLSAALSGLGLSIVKAMIATVDGKAQNTFFLQEVVFPGGGRKIWGTDRLSTIEGRLHQFFQRHSLQNQLKARSSNKSHGAAPGEVPSWAELVEEPPAADLSVRSDADGDDPPAADDDDPLTAALLATLTSAFMSEWVGSGSGSGTALSLPLARPLAVDVLRNMCRVAVAPEQTVVNEGGGEWLLLLEEPLVVQCTPASSRSTDTPHAVAEQSSESLATSDSTLSTTDTPLSLGTVLWSGVHTLNLSTHETWRARWSTFRPASASAPTHLRCIHRAHLRGLLVSLRETLARTHAAKVAELPLFAPLSSVDLVAFCRRATLVDVPPHAAIVSPPPAPAALPSRADPIPRDAFALILRGDALLSVHSPPDAAATPLVDVASAAVGTPALDASRAPPSFAFHRLDFGGILGETEASLCLPHVSVDAGEEGCLLLCWRREAAVVRVLAKLPLLLPHSWRARAPLALMAYHPSLSRLAVPRRLDELPAASETDSMLGLVLCGEVIETGGIEVQLTPLQPAPTAAATAAPEFELSVRLPSRYRLLADLSATLSRLRLDVLDGEICTEADGRAHDRLRVRDVMPRRRRRTDTAALAEQVRAALHETLEGSRLRVGECLLLGESVAFHAAEGTPPPTIGCVDLRAVGLAAALRDDATGRALRRFVACLTPALLAVSGGEGDGLAELEAKAHAAATDATVFVAADYGQQWLDALLAFNLHQLREEAGRGDDALVLRQLQLGGELGAGATGLVRLARDVLSGRLYAVKSFSKKHLHTDAGKRVLRNLERERDLLRMMANAERGEPCRWVIHMVASGQDEHNLHIVLPACLGGELWDVLAEYGPMDEDHLRFYVACLIIALEKLHSLGVVYRDLKPENVLLHADGWPVLADLGLAGFTLHEHPLFSLCGTPEFMAPEVLQHRGYGTAVDWWSLGILMTQCLTLTTPFEDPHRRPQKTFENILANKITSRREQLYSARSSEHACALIDSLLDRDAGRRLGGASTTSANLRPHPFFWGLDWRALQERQMRPPHAAYTAARGAATEQSFALADGADADLDGECAVNVPGW